MGLFTFCFGDIIEKQIFIAGQEEFYELMQILSHSQQAINIFKPQLYRQKSEPDSIIWSFLVTFLIIFSIKSTIFQSLKIAKIWKLIFHKFQNNALQLGQ